MQPISSAFSSLPPAADFYPSSGAFRSSDLTRLTASTETHTDLSITTAGGDLVTLSVESLFRFSSVELNDHRTDQGSSLDLHAEASATQVRNSSEVSIQGQLDTQEEADLRQLVGKLEKVVRKFLRGDIEGALSKALKIGDLGTVASFQLDVQQSQQIAVTQEQHSVADAAPALQAQKGAAESQGNAPSLVNQIGDVIEQADIDANKLLKQLPRVLKHLFDTLHAKVSDGDVARLSSDIEAWLAGKSHSLAPANQEAGTPAEALSGL
jgi:hypothetical protein